MDPRTVLEERFGDEAQGHFVCGEPVTLKHLDVCALLSGEEAFLCFLTEEDKRAEDFSSK